MVHYPPKPPPRGTRKRPPDEKARTAIANDLLELQAIGALVARAFVATPRAIIYRTPAQWKGTTDSDAIELRLAEWQGWLAGEREVWAEVQRLGKTLRHNAVEALAMSLARAGRFRL